jgi:hypothetical protein
MLKAFKIALLALILVTFCYADNCFAEEITNYNDLIENGKVLDGSKITITGEAIGEPMKRGNYTWVNISDGSNAIGIWLKSSDVQKISFYGNNKAKGDTVKISGEFHRACTDHGGDMDIHSLSIEIAEKGYSINEIVNTGKEKLGLILSLVTAVLAYYNLIYFRSKQARR